MFLGRLFHRVRNAFKGPSPPISGGDDLAADLERLDKEDPNWDRNMRITSATSAFESGMTRALIFKIYGEDIVTEAERLHRERLDKKDR